MSQTEIDLLQAQIIQLRAAIAKLRSERNEARRRAAARTAQLRKAGVRLRRL